MPEQIKRLRDRLVQPVGAPPRPSAAAQAPQPASTPAAHASSAADQGTRKLTPAERSTRLHTTRIRKAEAAGDQTALLAAWTDRIRAAKNPALSRKAAAALADLYRIHTNSRE